LDLRNHPKAGKENPEEREGREREGKGRKERDGETTPKINFWL